MSWLMIINVAFKVKFDKLTMTKGWEIHTQPGWFVVMYILFGIFMFIFYKPIREFRKIHYMKCKVRHYEFWVLIHGIPYRDEFTNFTDKDDSYYEYIKYKRYLLIKELSRKSKRNVLFGKIGL